MKFDLIHYVRVAGHFWPWSRAFWVAIIHDAKEDGWHKFPFVWEFIYWPNMHDVDALTRKRGEAYFDYIERVKARGGHAVEVKRADLIENYKRAWPSLRKRYAKALLALAD